MKRDADSVEAEDDELDGYADEQATASSLPTPERIRAVSKEIRSTWSKAIRKSRGKGGRSGPVETQVVDLLAFYGRKH